MKTKGFTLVELVIVIVIVGILTIVSFTLYKDLTRKNMATEGRSLLDTIQTAEKVYFAEYASFMSVENTSFNSVLDVDARTNKYFKTFSISASGTGSEAKYTAKTAGTGGASGISLTLIGSSQGTPTFIDTGLNN